MFLGTASKLQGLSQQVVVKLIKSNNVIRVKGELVK